MCLLPAPAGLRACPLTWDGKTSLVLSFPLPRPRWPASLTEAEREVATMLFEGTASAEMARRRGTSERTIVNQIASIFRKVGVGSRAELVARLFRRQAG